MAEKKAVLNVTVSESIAAAVRRIAAREHSTISSVVERALLRELRWEQIRLDGLKAIDEYYREHGYPTAQEMAEAQAQVAEEERLIDEALAAMEAERRSQYHTGESPPGAFGAFERGGGIA
jgi:predicted transcriptional regulator